MVLLPFLFACLQAPLVELARDDLTVRKSCRIQVAAAPIADRGSEGVLRIEGDGIMVDFEGGLLRGAPSGRAPDRFDGVGIVVTGRNVTLRNARVAGFKTGILARGADGLRLEDLDVSGNFRQHLGSTPEREDPADWLFPQHNDEEEWRRNYGAGIYIARSRDITVARCRARKGQNGLILDRVTGARIFDNDFSFLSGWGLALWRSSGNVIAHNALDFCVRGYSHGVYNRGQDSAGLLLFEQCSGNLIAGNSVTHGGDGLFAFAGEEALGKGEGKKDPAGFKRRGCNDNLIVGNDFSDAAAHGLELTFSFGNRIEKNRFAGNGICGIWGGYSRDTQIQGNLFVENGAAGYGLERGGVDIEHGERNVIRGNTFRQNACGIHLWWDPDEGLAKLPWAQANGTASSDNRIADNRFEGDKLAIQLRQCRRTELEGNTLKGVGRELEASEGSTGKARLTAAPQAERPLPPLPGKTRPVGARKDLRGRDKIVVTEWGPWDPADGPPPAPKRKLLEADWQVTAFAWKTDPRKDPEAWRAEAHGAAPAAFPALDFVFGSGGPPGLPPDHFGTLARAEVAFPAGRWRLVVTSDDGVRVWVDGKRVVDNWTWHGPTTDTAVLDFPAARTVPVRVEHFELDGYAILRLQIEPAGD